MSPHSNQARSRPPIQQLIELNGHLAIAKERRARVDLVNQAHQRQVERRLGGGLPVEARPAQTEQRALLGRLSWGWFGSISIRFASLERGSFF